MHIYISKRGKIEIEGITRQNTENKSTFDMTAKIVNCNVSAKIEICEKTRQSAKNKLLI